MIPWVTGGRRPRSIIQPGSSALTPTRAHSPAGAQTSRTLPDGSIAFLGQNQARFTGKHQAREYRAQEQALLLQSQNLSSAAGWGGQGILAPVQNAGLGPDGATQGWTLTEDTSNGAHRWLRFYTNAAGTTGYGRAFISAGSRRYVNVYIGSGGLYFGVQVDTVLWTVLPFRDGGGVGSSRISPYPDAQRLF